MNIITKAPKRKPNRTLEQKALTVIETLASDDFCEKLAITKPDDLATKKLITIYKYSHAVVAACNHEDWKAELLETYKQWKRHRII